MRKLAIAVVSVLVITVIPSAAEATAINVGTATVYDQYYLGSIIPDNGNPPDEVNWINALLGLAADTDVNSGDDGDGNDLDGNGGTMLYDNSSGPDSNLSRDYSDLSTVGLAPATVTGHLKVQEPAGGGCTTCTAINVTGYTYLYGKYGPDAYVWVIEGLTSVDLPSSVDGSGGLSHYTLTYSTQTLVQVPDGGAAIGLLGLGILGVGYLRRRLS